MVFVSYSGSVLFLSLYGISAVCLSSCCHEHSSWQEHMPFYNSLGGATNCMPVSVPEQCSGWSSPCLAERDPCSNAIMLLCYFATLHTGLPESHMLIQLHLRQHSYAVLQVLQRGFHNLKAHVTTFTSASLTPDEFCLDVELTYAWSVMTEVFVVLQSKLCTSEVPPPELVHMLASYMDVMSSLAE